MDREFETSAAKEFERLFRLSGSERLAAATPLASDSPALRERTAALLDAYDRNIADSFLDPASSTATQELQRWLGEVPELGFPVPRSEAPTVVGTFRIIRPISEGDLCSIYLAEQTGPVVRAAAIKVLHSAARRRETLRRFDTERRAIAAMRHPNIAQFFEAGASGSGHAYFAMEYVDGPQITSFCANQRLSTPDRLQLFLQVCSAIAHAHQRGILHRDLKPSNILVAIHGDAGLPQAKVIDFGVAKAMESSDDSKATMTGQVVGTLAYMSPEQLRGDAGSIDTRADVFSLGLVLFEMLTGRTPYSGAEDPPALASPGTFSHALRRRADDPPLRLRAINPAFRGDLDTILAKATALEPELRYASIADFANDIERYLDGRPVLARNPGFVYTLAKFVRRNWIATSAAVLVAGSGAFAGVAVMQARAERSDLAIRFAQAWLEDVLATQRTIGESSAREPKATRLLQEVRQFEAQLPGEPRVRSMLASALTEVGYVNLAKGDFDAATRDFDEALAIRRGLATAGFGRLGGLGDLSLAMVRCGDAAGAKGDSRLRSGFYREAFEIDERAADAHPNDRMALSNLGWSYERLAVRLPCGDRSRLVLLTRQLEVFERLNAMGPTGDSEHGLSSGYSNLAITNGCLGLPFASEAQRALAHGRAAVALVPQDRHLVRATLKAEVIAADSQPDPAERARQLVHAITRTEAFCEQDPRDKLGEEVLLAAALVCDRLLNSTELDQAALSSIREAKQRIETRTSSSRAPVQR